jgi:hypothetical protein
MLRSWSPAAYREHLGDPDIKGGELLQWVSYSTGLPQAQYSVQQFEISLFPEL